MQNAPRPKDTPTRNGIYAGSLLRFPYTYGEPTLRCLPGFAIRARTCEPLDIHHSQQGHVDKGDIPGPQAYGFG
jgi:hypothetical protein